MRKEEPTPSFSNVSSDCRDCPAGRGMDEESRREPPKGNRFVSAEEGGIEGLPRNPLKSIVFRKELAVLDSRRNRSPCRAQGFTENGGGHHQGDKRQLCTASAFCYTLSGYSPTNPVKHERGEKL